MPDKQRVLRAHGANRARPSTADALTRDYAPALHNDDYKPADSVRHRPWNLHHRCSNHPRGDRASPVPVMAMTMTKDTMLALLELERIKAAGTDLAERNDAIRRALELGASLRDAAAMAGVSKTQVVRIRDGIGR